MTTAVAPLQLQLRTFRRSDVLFAAMAVAGVVLAFARADDAVGLLALLSGVASVVAIGWWDSRTLRAPNPAVAAGSGVALAFAAARGPEALGDALAGGAALFALLFVIWLAGRGAMGAGDVKFAALCGFVAGIRGVFPVLAVAFVVGGAIAAFALLSRRRGRKDVVAFTPFLAVGALVALAIYPVYLVR